MPKPLQPISATAKRAFLRVAGGASAVGVVLVIVALVSGHMLFAVAGVLFFASAAWSALLVRWSDRIGRATASS